MLTMSDSLCILPKKLTQLSIFSPKLRFLKTTIELPKRNVAFWSRRGDRDRPDFLDFRSRIETYLSLLDENNGWKRATHFTKHWLEYKGAVRQTSPSISIHLMSISMRSLTNATRWEQRHGLVWMYCVLRVTFANWIDCEKRHGLRQTSVDCACALAAASYAVMVFIIYVTHSIQP